MEGSWYYGRKPVTLLFDSMSANKYRKTNNSFVRNEPNKLGFFCTTSLGHDEWLAKWRKGWPPDGGCGKIPSWKPANNSLPLHGLWWKSNISNLPPARHVNVGKENAVSFMLYEWKNSSQNVCQLFRFRNNGYNFLGVLRARRKKY